MTPEENCEKFVEYVKRYVGHKKLDSIEFTKALAVVWANTKVD